MLSFPIMIHNIGLNKLLISKYVRLKEKYEVVFDLQPHEDFVDFVEFNDIKAVGLNIEKLRIETCSRFAYLTLDKK